MSNRRGFSLIELLVVIGIIAVLATLSIVVMQGTVTQAREQATAMTITKVSELVEERILAFDRAAKNSVLKTAAEDVQYGFAVFFEDQDPPAYTAYLRERTAEIIARKQLFREFFPQRFGEMPDDTDTTGTPGSPNGIPDLIDRIQRSLAPADRFESLVDNHDPATESAEVLYMVLTEMAVFGVEPTGTDAFSGGEIEDTDGDGLPEFVDAWGNPLRFYRWPTRLFDMAHGDDDPAWGMQSTVTADERSIANLLVRGLPNTNGITRDPLQVDPDDTIGRIGFEILARPALASAYNEAAFHTVDVFHTPLVMSAGADGVLGIVEPNLVDADINGNGVVDSGIPVGSTGQFDFYSEDGLSFDAISVPTSGNGVHDNILGNLAVVPDGDGDADLDDDDIRIVFDSLTDNITNRNRRAGGTN